MKSEPNDFFPRYLKWASMACFSVLAGGLAFAYLTAPKLDLEDFTTATELSAEELLTTTHLPDSTTNQRPATLKGQTDAQQSDQSAQAPESTAGASTVQSEQVVDDPEHDPIPQPTVSAKEEVNGVANSWRRYSVQSKSCIDETIGLIYSRTKAWVYISRQDSPQQYNVMRQAFPKADHFCSRQEAIEAGYTVEAKAKR